MLQPVPSTPLPRLIADNALSFTSSFLVNYVKGAVTMDTLVRARGERFQVPGFDRPVPLETALLRVLFAPPCVNISVRLQDRQLKPPM